MLRSFDETCDSWKPIVVATSLRENPYYSRFYNTLTRLVLLGISPFVLLTYFNCKIYYGMQLPVELLDVNTYCPSGSRNDNRRKQENEAARVLIAIVAVFIVCHTMRVITDFYEMIYIENITACHAKGKNGVHSWVLILNEFSSVMITLNSSVNMIIYGLIKPNIRKHIFKWNIVVNQRNQTQESDPFEMEEVVISQRTTNYSVNP